MLKHQDLSVQMAALAGDTLTFGRDGISSKPVNTRLIATMPQAVAKAAIGSGVDELFYPVMTFQRRWMGTAHCVCTGG